MPKLRSFQVWGLVTLLGAWAPAASSHAEGEAQPEVVAPTPWYVGGTLHKAVASDWLSASLPNQLATAADWLLASKEVKAKVDASGDMDALQPHAEKLRQCVTLAVYRNKKLYANVPVADVATTCILTMKF